MAWTLVQENSKGWKKYIDENGNYHYKKPNGHFANSKQWGGGIGNNPPEFVNPSAPTKLYEEKDFYQREKDLTESPYSLFIQFVKEERPPKIIGIEPQRISESPYSLQELRYPLDERVEQLTEVTENNQNYHLYRWAFKYTVIKLDDEYNISERDTSILGTKIYPVGKDIVGYENFNLENLQIDFMSKFDQLANLADSYTEVIINETLLEVRNLPNP